MKVYKMGPEERERRGLAGREWAMSDEAGFTAEKMGERFVDMSAPYDTEMNLNLEKVLAASVWHGILETMSNRLKITL